MGPHLASVKVVSISYVMSFSRCIPRYPCIFCAVGLHLTEVVLDLIGFTLKSGTLVWMYMFRPSHPQGLLTRGPDHSEVSKISSALTLALLFLAYLRANSPERNAVLEDQA